MTEMSDSFLAACSHRVLDTMPGCKPQRRGSLRCWNCGLYLSGAWVPDFPQCCLTCHANRRKPQTSSSKTLLSQLPSDVLRLIVPHLLLGVVRYNAAYPECYMWATTADSLRAVKHRAVTMVIQSAWLPMLRTKLICKALRDAVDSHMTGLMQPAAACNEAASTIQRALRANYLCVVNVELD